MPAHADAGTRALPDRFQRGEEWGIEFKFTAAVFGFRVAGFAAGIALFFLVVAWAAILEGREVDGLLDWDRLMMLASGFISSFIGLWAGAIA